MLGERLEKLSAFAELKGVPEYYKANAENYGFANGLRCAVATMTGVEYQPFIPPEDWQPNDDAMRAELRIVKSQLAAALESNRQMFEQLEDAGYAADAVADAVKKLVDSLESKDA